MSKKESIFRLIAQKPWDSEQAKVDNMHKGSTINLNNGKFGLRYLMVISTIFFSLFVVTYSDRLVYPDWRSMPEPLMLWFNTFILVVTSGFFVSAQKESNKNNFTVVKKRMIATGFLTLLFLFGQLLVWLQLVDQGYYVSLNPANAYFYVFTALHGLHLLGGMVYWFMTIKTVWKPTDIVVAKAKHTVELCGIYWHFLLAVWVVLFGLMLFT